MGTQSSFSDIHHQNTCEVQAPLPTSKLTFWYNLLHHFLHCSRTEWEACPFLSFMYVIIFHSPPAAWLCVRLGPIRKQKPHYNFEQGWLDVKNSKPRSESSCKNARRTRKSTLWREGHNRQGNASPAGAQASRKNESSRELPSTGRWRCWPIGLGKSCQQLLSK